ncbi:hypothetical protein NM208_g8946 [Fusarium decemcellulare]|uniref:Uncharacterized protein n=1 Tax=Fusarium decemcellulare TaxID=57161 RepID=A0ACC1S3N0_9HYPO|nr:hypothetical protein NM208_g8946 [Fusarium decemcellulare]
MAATEVEVRLPPGSVPLVTASSTLQVPTPSTDPNDPLAQNWSMARKVINTTFVLATTVAVFAAMTMQTIFWQQMTVDMDVTFDQLNWGVSFNVAGLAIGCVLFIPLSKKYGRRLTYVASTGIMAAIADLFFVNQRGTVNGFYISCVMLGNFVAPTLAGIQAAAQGWRWTYNTCAIVLSLLFVLFLFLYEETKYIPLSVGDSESTGFDLDRSTADDKTPPLDTKTAQNWRADDLEQSASLAAIPPPNSYKQRMRFVTTTDEPLWRNYITPLKVGMFPHVLFAGIQCANAVIFLVLLTSVNSIAFSSAPYNFDTAGVGLMLIGPFVGNILGSVYGGWFGDWLIVRLARRNDGIFEPEMRLYILGLPALSMGAGLIVYGVTLDHGLHWIYPSIGGALFSFGMGSMMDVSCTIVIDTYQSVTAEAFVLVTFIRNASCIGLPFGVVPWMNSMSLTNIFVISGFIATIICLLFIPLMLVAEKKQRLSNAIPPQWRLDQRFLDDFTKHGNGRLLSLDPARRSGILNNLELEITEKYSATELVHKLARGDLKAVDVVTAFCKRAAIAQQLVTSTLDEYSRQWRLKTVQLSCLTETFFQEAIQRAQRLDEHYERTGKPCGPLHGLPISLKASLDTFKVIGHDATAGYVAGLKLGSAKENSCLVDLLIDAGAVPYVKTNVPQTMMTADSENNIFGRTLNPHNTDWTAGGSSGGEGALVAFRGSPLGVGTDIAGSVRIPAMCCGTYGFKPSNNRVPYGKKSEGVLLNLPGPFPSAGPLAISFEDIQLFMNTVISGRPAKYDSTALDLPWRTPVLPSKLCIGVLPEDPAYPLHPPVRRVLDSAVASLTRAGHKIIQLPHDTARSVETGLLIAFQYFELGHEPDEDLAAILGEPLVKSVAAKMHPFTNAQRPVPLELDAIHRLDKLDRLRAHYVQEWKRTWFDNGLDAILAPGADKTAVPHDTYGMVPYTALFNLLDFPSCLIPTGKVSKHLDSKPFEATVAFTPDYDPEVLDGAPCGIQVVTPTLRDEECLAAAAIIDRDIKAYQFTAHI